MTVKRIREIAEWLNKNKKSHTPSKMESLKWFILKRNENKMKKFLKLTAAVSLLGLIIMNLTNNESKEDKTKQV